MADKEPKKKFQAKRWTIIDGKKVELDPVEFRLREEEKKDSREDKKKSA